MHKHNKANRDADWDDEREIARVPEHEWKPKRAPNHIGYSTTAQKWGGLRQGPQEKSEHNETGYWGLWLKWEAVEGGAISGAWSKGIGGLAGNSDPQHWHSVIYQG